MNPLVVSNRAAGAHSDSGAYWAAKFALAPIFALMGVVAAMPSGGTRRQLLFSIGVIALPLFLATGWAATLAAVRIRHDDVEVRRWFTWHFVPCSQIQSAGQAICCGYLRLRRPVPPWGFLYFALDAGVHLPWFGRRGLPEDKLLASLQDALAVTRKRS